MAGHGGEDEVDLLSEQQRLAVLDQIVVDIAQQLFGIALFDEIPAISTLIGALVVLAAVTYIAFREGRNRVAGA